MKILRLIPLLLLSTVSAFAQVNFKQILPPSPAPQIIPAFESVDQGAIAYADVDGIDGTDVLITGSNSDGDPIAKLYINDGNGNYTEKTGTPFTGVLESSVAFADIDDNGTQDVLIAGFDGTIPTSKLYTNDGNGNFTEVAGANFDGVRESDIAFADLDGNGSQDVLITGRKDNDEIISKLYMNDGSGIFTPANAANTAEFAKVHRGAIAFADIDGGSGIDVMISGISGSLGTPVTEVYLNDGDASFTQVSGTSFEALKDNDVAFADVDDNGTQDLLISGYNSSNQPVTKLYTNDGSANFTESSETFEGLRYSSVAFADVDATNGPDVLITGFNNSSQPITKLYTNDGSGSFTEVSGTPFKNVSRGAVAFLDVDGDSDSDLVLSGRNSANNPVTEIYVNDGVGVFTLATGTPFTGVRVSSSAFADVDENGTEDLIITGRNNDNDAIVKLYSNDGNGNFIEVTGTSFTGVGNSDVAFADVDGINGPDVLISGVTSSFPFQYLTNLYTNNGDGTFTKVTNPLSKNLSNGSIALADISEDANNDLDVVITGIDNTITPFTKLYTNDGSGNFTEVAGTSFSDVFNSSIAFADVDGANGPDLIISGENSGTGTTELYLNDGSGGFSSSSETFEAVRNSSIAVGDTDGDGSPDLLVTGLNDSNAPVAKLYTNDGSGSFTEVTGTPFEAVESSSAKIVDIDGVNGNDVIISGESSSGEYITKIYINDGSGNFSEVLNMPFEGVFEGDISLSDVDGDGLTDVLITGQNNSGTNISKLYRNTTDFIPPSITSATSASADENQTNSFYTATADEEVTFSLGNTKDEAFFRINNNGEISFLNAPDFENPQDANTDNVYLIDLIVTDQGLNEVSQEVAVTVNDIDDTDPTITSSATVSVQENTSSNFYTATADESVTFSLGSSKDEAFFSLSTDAIKFASAPDFETPQDGDADNEYLIDITATDSNGNSSTMEVAITVTDVAEAGPVITSPATATVEENVTGTVYTATADVSATFSLGSSKDEALFSLSTDAISFNDSPDFETPQDANTDNVYQLDIIATDGGGNSTVKTISITVTDVDDTNPSITSASTVSVEENTTGEIYTATANESVTFSLGSNKDEALFNLSTDVISFKEAPNFENPQDADADNVYIIDITATDTNGNSSGMEVVITVTDVEEAGPVITSPATATVEENVTGTVYTATADASATFSLGSSKDEALFSLSTDAISFNDSPDFETPLDANSDNVYQLDIVATDGDGNSTTKAISITVTDVDETGPVVTSPATATVEENVTGTVYTAAADVSATFSLGSSKDEALFSLSTDAISFNDSPDFENPLDANSDNVYQLDIIATDENGNSTTKTISITVTDIEEEPLATTDEILSKIYPNPVQHTLFIQPVNMSRDASIRIFDLSGRIQKNIIYKGKEQEIDVSDLTEGVYMLMVNSNGKQMQLKFIKK